MFKKTYIAAFALSGALALAQTSPTTAQGTDPAQSPKSNTQQQGSQATDTQAGSKSSDMKKSSKSTKMSESSSASGGESMVGTADRSFITKAAEGGMMEVQLAQLAQRQAASDEVKQYAQKLEQDHTAANKQLMDIAQRRGVNVPSTLKPEDQQMIDKLSKMNGTEFDREYIKHMVKDHKKDVKEFEKQSQKSMDTDLKTFASNTAPTLKDHLSRAETIDKTLSASGSRSRTKETKSNSSTDTTGSSTGTTGTTPQSNPPSSTTPPPQK